MRFDLREFYSSIHLHVLLLPSTSNFNDAEMSRWQSFSSFDRWSRLLFHLSEERSDSDSFNGWIVHLWNWTFQEQQRQHGEEELRTSGGEHRLHAVCWWKLRVRYRVCMHTDIDCLSFDRFYWMNSHYSLYCFRDRLSSSWREMIQMSSFCSLRSNFDNWKFIIDWHV